MADPADALGLRHEPPHDYGRLPPTRWRQPWSDRAVKATTAIGALLVGLLLVSVARVGHEAAVEAGERKAELLGFIEARQARTEQLSAHLEELRQQVADAEAAAAAGLPALQAALESSEAAAGLTAMAGPGLRVTFADADEPCPQAPESCRIRDTDLQEAVNTLFAIGAEAVAINGERVIATTAVRSAGRAILVNFRVLSSPYVIEAIGDPALLEQRLEASQLAADFALWSTDYGLGYGVERIDELVLPAFNGSLRLRSAAPADGVDVGAGVSHSP